MSLFLSDPVIHRSERLTQKHKTLIYDTITHIPINRQDLISNVTQINSRISKHQILKFVSKLIEHDYVRKTNNILDMRRIWFIRTERTRRRNDI